MLSSSQKPGYKNTVEDDTWLQASEFCKDDHKIFNINRQDKRGMALLYFTKYKIKTVTHTKYSSFESGVWNMQSRSIICTLLGIYHLPVWTQQGITNSIFIDDLTELLTEVVSKQNDLIILRNINIHLSEPEDTDAKAVHDTLEACNITQHINFPTHNLGHTLDNIATEIRQKQKCHYNSRTLHLRSLINCCSTQRQNRINEIRVQMDNGWNNSRIKGQVQQPANPGCRNTWRCSISTRQSVAKYPWRSSTTNYKKKIKPQKTMLCQTT